MTIKNAQFATPPLTTVQMSYVEVANAAFRTLLDSVEAQCNGALREVHAIQSNLVLSMLYEPGARALREGAAGKRADSGLPPKEFN